MQPLNQRLVALLFLLLTLVSGCSTLPDKNVAQGQWHYGNDTTTLAARYSPLISVENGAQRYNRIGHAAARIDNEGEEEIYIATNQAVIYTQQQPFTTAHGDYLNLIYRLHLPRVPARHLTAGNNGGLIVVVTLNAQRQPLLITTVHSCGCYLAFVPTSLLPASAYPDGWAITGQEVYGEWLPGLLNYPLGNNWHPHLLLRSGNHRVMNIDVAQADQLPNLIATELQPMTALEQLPLGDGTTSFFYHQGRLRGYVKNAYKPWEQLLMSWWTFDLNIGRDKMLGDPEETGVVFYTSLKPWARDESNLWFFADFLSYWGWRL